MDNIIEMYKIVRYNIGSNIIGGDYLWMKYEDYRLKLILVK